MVIAFAPCAAKKPGLKNGGRMITRAALPMIFVFAVSSMVLMMQESHHTIQVGMSTGSGG